MLQTKMVSKKIRWKVIYRDMKGKSIKTETHGLQSQ